MSQSNFSKTFVLCLGVLAMIFVLNYLVLASWAEPEYSPPEGNISAPLNVGNIGQSKIGGLILNTGNATTGLIIAYGDVGIGTYAPSAKLDITGAIRGINEYSFSGYNDAINDWTYSGLTTNPTGYTTADDSWYVSSNFADWNRGILSKRSFTRTPGLTLEYEMNQQLMPPVTYSFVMVGFVDGSSTSYSYNQTPSNLLFHSKGTRLQIYENSGYVASTTLSTLNAWYKFKVTLNGRGASYYVYNNGIWNLIATTVTNSNKNVKILMTVHSGTINIRNMRVYQENSQLGNADDLQILIPSAHTKKDCTGANGQVVPTFSGSAGLQCRIPGSSCPSGWTQFKNWSSTIASTSPNGCISCGTAPCPCTTGSHEFSDKAPESCDWTYMAPCGNPPISCCSTPPTRTIYAKIVEIGCY
jgi:hypothetical protein